MTFNYVRLDEAKEFLREAKEYYQSEVMRARAAGESWGAIARELGVSKQSLHKRFGPKPSGAATGPGGGPDTDPLFD